MSKVTEAVAALDAMPENGDQEALHDAADGILLTLVPPVVAEAYRRARDRVGFWYA